MQNTTTPLRTMAAKRKSPLLKNGNAKECGECSSSTNNLAQHPDHSNVLNRLHRTQGQLQAVEKMILEQRYCLDILVQLRAVASAAKAIEGAIIEKHLRNCVSDALRTKNANAAETKITELMELFKRV